MTTLREAAQQALEALKKQQEALKVWPDYFIAPHEYAAIDAAEKAITALRAALAIDRSVVKQALEALKLSTPQPRPTDDDYSELGWKEHNAAITALKAALAEPEKLPMVEIETVLTMQGEPVQEPVAWVCEATDSREKHSIDYYTSTVDALPVGTLLYTAPPKVEPVQKPEGGGNLPPPLQANPVAWRYKPMIGSPWSVSDDGYYISCKRDKGYTVEPLYTAPPQRTMVPLTEKEIDALPWNGSPRQFARAVEKAVWEKNHD